MARNPLNPRGPYKKKPVIDRLLARIEIDAETGCHIWKGAKAAQMGYGVIGVDGKNAYVHRVAYEHARGAIPVGSLVCHSCDRPLCCNPDHLFLGSHKENTADAVEKGRIAFGERSGGARLNQLQAVEIRERLAIGGETHEAIAKDYGISRSVVTRIKSRELWARTETPNRAENVSQKIVRDKLRDHVTVSAEQTTAEGCVSCEG